MIVVDVETTGLESVKHSIVSIGALDFLEPINQFYKECRIWEGAEIDDYALVINGFSRADVVDANKSSLDETIRSFLFWVGNIPSGHDITLAGENPKFDSNFLESSAKRYNLAWPFSHRTVDLHTISYAYRASRGIEIPLNKARCSNLKQDETLKYVGLLDEPMPHNALTGAKGEAEAFSRLMFGRSLLPEYTRFKIPPYLIKL